MFQKIAILGAGLIGASILRTAHARKLAKNLVAWSPSEASRKFCLSQPWCDGVATDPAAAAEDADLVIACTPVDTIAPVLAAAAPSLKTGALVTDVGSAKLAIHQALQDVIPPRAVYIGSHPMAGSEKAGPGHSSDTLFQDRMCFVTPASNSSNGLAVRTLTGFWLDLGMRVVEVPPETHDAIVANNSHLPHLVAAALANVMLRHPAQWGSLAGMGLRDTTRVAAGSPLLWSGIVSQNRGEILRALAELQEELGEVSRAIQANDPKSLGAFLAKAQAWRSAL
ncbi:MAG: prephenate dehydrogenase/arogenate dehydrogenase family protein [Puniceicoccales bacterium]|jgi:prephenate dehydrogenase|nr:prephenate dehydrogenase/arogenate dehydrogenase family protein [Puniceicoccales bacterium]